MPLPQVNDRLKEIPAQALRTLFATIGQLLLVADRLRARAAEQLSGSGETTAAPPSEQARATAPPARPAAPRPAPAQDAESARWRSLDKTGNFRLLDEQDEDDLAAPATPAAPEPSITEPVTQAAPEPVPAPDGYTPTQPVHAVPAPAEPAPADFTTVPDPVELAPAESAPADVTTVPDLAEPAPAEPAQAGTTLAGTTLAGTTLAGTTLAGTTLAGTTPAGTTPAGTTPAGTIPAQPAPAAALSGEALPVPNYDQLTVASLRARLRVLDAGQVRVLLDYEKSHEGRPAVITLFERRLTKLSEGS